MYEVNGRWWYHCWLQSGDETVSYPGGVEWKIRSCRLGVSKTMP